MRGVAAVLAFGLALAAAADAPVVLNGAGATFPFPVYAKWFDSFHKKFPEIEVRYQPVGSEAGIQRLKAGSVDFAASDVKISSGDYFAGGKPQYLRFPTVLGAVVPVYNVAGLPRDVKFTGEVLAGVYLGKVKRWNDPALQAVNRGAALPDREIVVVHRADGSGTSYVWTDYLAKISPGWKSAVGASSLPEWPVGVGAAGNDGVAKLVSDRPGSIGYVEYIYAITNHMSYGIVRNSAGKYISPDLESIAAAAEGSSNRIAEDFQTSITNAPGPDAYPIASFSWFVVPAEVSDSSKKRALKELLQWVLGAGQNQAAALGYVAVPKQLLAREQRVLEGY